MRRRPDHRGSCARSGGCRRISRRAGIRHEQARRNAAEAPRCRPAPQARVGAQDRSQDRDRCGIQRLSCQGGRPFKASGRSVGSENMKIKTNGIELNYTVEGNGPWLVMSHSLACDLTMWDEQAAVLRRNFKVLRFDTRGHGASDAPEGEYTLDMMAYDVHGLLQALSVERCHWVGLSMGGMIGQTFALKFPGMFATLVLAD